MFFLLCVTIYLVGLAIFYHMWSWQARHTPERRPNLLLSLGVSSIAMLSLCVLSSLLMVAQGILPGILRTISLILYHATVIEPLFLASALGILTWRSRRHAAPLQRPVWSPSLIVFCACVLCVSAIGLWSMHIEPYWLDVHHVQPVTLQQDRPLGEEVTVAILADLQHDTITPFQRKIVASTMAARPDLILIPGDLYDSPAASAHVEEFRALLATLSAPLGVFMVVGDHDRLDVLREMTRGTDVILLDDQRARRALNAQHTLEIVGLSIPARDAFDRAMARPLLEQHSALSADARIVRIVLVHRPRHVLYLHAQDDVSLVVAGHTHGGQISLPFFGPPVTISPLPRSIAAGGLHRLPATWLYISRGLGGVQQGVPLIRFNCRPELPIPHLR